MWMNSPILSRAQLRAAATPRHCCLPRTARGFTRALPGQPRTASLRAHGGGGSPGASFPGPASDSAQEARTATVGSPRSALAFPSVWLHPERAPTTAQEQRASLRLQVAGAPAGTHVTWPFPFASEAASQRQRRSWSGCSWVCSPNPTCPSGKRPKEARRNR